VEQYLKSPREMARLFRDMPDAVIKTEEIAERCNLELDIGKLHFPKFGVPEGENDYSYLTKLAYAGACKKYGTLTPKIRERLERELATIRTLGFCGYFLVVWDNYEVGERKRYQVSGQGQCRGQPGGLCA